MGSRTICAHGEGADYCPWCSAPAPEGGRERDWTRTVKDSPATGRITLEQAQEAARKAHEREYERLKCPHTTVLDGMCQKCGKLNPRAALARPAGEAEPVATLDDPYESAYWNLRTCVCGEDATAHAAGSNCRGFDPDWPLVRERLYTLQQQASAWEAVYDRCKALGMVGASSGLADVLAFIDAHVLGEEGG